MIYLQQVYIESLESRMSYLGHRDITLSGQLFLNLLRGVGVAQIRVEILI